MHRRIALLALASVAALACGREAADGDRAADSTAAAAEAAPPVPIRATPEQFAALGWLRGSWRGTLPDGGSFYERYRVVDDSTIVMHAYEDSTFTRATDSSRITLRGGIVASEGAGGSRWEATRLDAAAAEFAAVRGASNRFTWTNNGPDAWTATLVQGGGGTARTVVYPMERVGR
jgi:hypothetical protein